MPASALSPTLAMNSGTALPRLGLGVWQAGEGGTVEAAVLTALEAGYRLIDTATAYGNERGVGRAVRSSGLPRQDIFLTTKLWNDSQAYDAALRAFDASLERLGTDYVDLYLVHWPLFKEGRFTEAWRALERIYAEGRAKAIGVSNFTPVHLEALLAEATVVPAVNQIELHPLLQQAETRAYCRERGIRVQAHTPLRRSRELLQLPVIGEIAARHGRTPAQVVLRWHLQSGLAAIPKSVTPARIRENYAAFQFVLSDEDMRRLAALDAGDRVGADPDEAYFR